MFPDMAGLAGWDTCKSKATWAFISADTHSHSDRITIQEYEVLLFDSQCGPVWLSFFIIDFFKNVEQCALLCLQDL